jgi:pyruvate,orthophosphate dikinase
MKSMYRFGRDVVDGDGSMTMLLGGKGAGLAEMTSLGVPVPPGFTISIDVCRFYQEHGILPDGLESEIDKAITWLEAGAGRSFGDPKNPLLVSVRSGAPISMPGMMDTILNVGLNDCCVLGLATTSGSPRFAHDSYMRLMHMFGSVVLGVPKASMEEIDQAGEGSGDAVLRRREVKLQEIIRAKAAVVFPQDAKRQLMMAIEAVFQSWNSERARFYRTLNKISDDLGTAVTVQMMVFGNSGEDSGTGVGFTRDPSTGEKQMFAEFLPNAQGEDIVAGTRTPLSIRELAERMPSVYTELARLTTLLEKHYRDVQDFEFTIERGSLYLLQTRAAKRSALSAVKTAVDMAKEGLISRKEAIRRVKPASLVEILCPQLDLSGAEYPILAQGISASPGAAVGQIATSSDFAVELAHTGVPVILITEETTAEDIKGMAASVGFLTAKGGATSHAAVVARGMGKCCVTGAKAVHVNTEKKTVTIGSHVLQEGDWITLDGGSGCVFDGQVPTKAASADQPDLKQLLQWAREEGNCVVRANAETIDDAQRSRIAGAAGIGLCRTEHMFFEPDRLPFVREMILADSVEAREQALNILLPMQQRDFEILFRTMAPHPVTIRLLDPPLHEFLPPEGEIAAQMIHARQDEDWERCITLEKIKRRIQALEEVNPMMGHRGCRLVITYPEILTMQVKAILLAALTVSQEGQQIVPEIMMPLVSSEEEMAVLAKMIRVTATDVFREAGRDVDYKIGTMIELPRAALCAAEIAQHVSFISFGTNDLTQMTFGFSRDDSRSYLESYLAQGILKVDPFVSIDQRGVGQLMKMAVSAVREAYPHVKIGVCGEHGGDPDSIRFFRSLGVDYVSCSPSRIPIAQLACAQ